MKIVVIGKPQAAGYLSENAIAFLKEKGFEHAELTEANPAIDLLERNNLLLVEAVEKYNDEMPYLEIITVPEGKYAILGVNHGQEGTVHEIVVRADAYWQPSTRLCEIIVEEPVKLENIASVYLQNRLKRINVCYLHELEAFTLREIMDKCGIHIRGSKGKGELEQLIEEYNIKLKAE